MRAELAAAMADERVRRRADEGREAYARRWNAVYHRELARMTWDPFETLIVNFLGGGG